MSETQIEAGPHDADLAPGDEALDGAGVAQGAWGYVIGLALALGLTAASFYFAGGKLIWAPAIPAVRHTRPAAVSSLLVSLANIISVSPCILSLL